MKLIRFYLTTKRAEYDTYGRTFNDTQGGHGANPGQNGFGFDFSGFNTGDFEDFNMGDIFSQFFGGGRRGTQARRGADISANVEISFQEAVFGVERELILNKTSQCDVCKGTGAEPGTEVKTCPGCNGKGKVHETKNSFLGTFTSTHTCTTCNGTGKVPTEKCKICRGVGVVRKQEHIKLKVPAGINNGEMIRFTGGGEAVSGGSSGDLYVKIHVKKHPLFRKEGNNLVTDLTIKLSTALLGGEYTLETLDGPLTVKVPQGIEFGEILRVKGKGVPYERNHRGDLLIKVQIQLPRKISRTASKLIEDLKKEGM